MGDFMMFTSMIGGRYWGEPVVQFHARQANATQKMQLNMENGPSIRF
jgi:hypothetical protein